MSRRIRTINVPHLGNGIDVSADAQKISTKGNAESLNMTYDTNGSCKTSFHARELEGIDWGEGAKLVQGSFIIPLFPSVVFVAINGKIKYTDLSNPEYNVYEVDTAISLDTEARVKFGQWRGQLYFCNGVDVMGRISIGRIKTAYTTGSTTIELEDEQGYRFKNGTAKAYIGNSGTLDEIDYTGISASGIGDDMTGVSNITADGVAGNYITQYNVVNANAKDFAIFKDTMFYIPFDEPGILNYGETIASIGDLQTGALHDFSAGENYIVGDGGELTAVHATETRLYIGSKDVIDYITTQINPITGFLEFSNLFSFTKNYGVLNPFCFTQMEDMDVFLSGSRLIRLGYAPANDQILPNKDFDQKVLPLLNSSDKTGAIEYCFYDADSKHLFVAISMEGKLRIITRSEQAGAYAYPLTLDMRTAVSYNNDIYFFDSIGRTYVIDGGLTSEGGSENHRFVSAKLDNRNRDDKLFLKGRIEGKMKKSSLMYFTSYVDGNKVGKEKTMDINTVKVLKENIETNTGVGSSVVGSVTTGGNLQGETNIIAYEYSFLIGARGKDVQIEIASNLNSEYWTIDNISIDYVPQQTNNSTYR